MLPYWSQMRVSANADDVAKTAAAVPAVARITTAAMVRIRFFIVLLRDEKSLGSIDNDAWLPRGEH
ncbi:hypothetical protein ACFQX7_32815 [Luedemannella flava]